MLTRIPPRKQPGQGKGPRRIDGAALDIRGGSALCGWSEKQSRGMVARGLMPHRRLGQRIIFIKSELEAWLSALKGITLDEALENLKARRGE
jgi:hypothetical protein